MNDTPIVSAPESPRRRTLLSARAFIVLAVAVALVAGTYLRIRGWSSKPTVAVVGDSITLFSGTDISTALGNGYDADIHAGIGRRIDEMLPTLEAVARAHPFAVAINLGSNDALQARTHPDWRTGVDRMLALLTPGRCVLLTTINVRLPGPGSTSIVANNINTALDEAARAHTNFHVVDWNAALRGKEATLLTVDQIHPSPAGQLTLAALTRTALVEHCHK
ncbi:MAG: putative acyltransferase [Actinomycetia bacterium]|nr:putative acyltransferase [Actinomycetes bacterium]